MSLKKKLEEIVKDLRKELNDRLGFLTEKVVKGKRSLSRQWFDLEFGVVSPFYYKLQRHLIVRDTRDHHPHLSDLKLTLYLDKEGKSYKDKLLDIPGDKKP